MTILEKLAELGFTDATDLGSANDKGSGKSKTLVRIWTSKGWFYDRVSEDEIAELAERLQPGSPE